MDNLKTSLIGFRNDEQAKERGESFATELRKVFEKFAETHGDRDEVRAFFTGEKDGQHRFFGLGVCPTPQGFFVTIDAPVKELIARYFPGSVRKDIQFNFSTFRDSAFGRFTIEFLLC